MTVKKTTALLAFFLSALAATRGLALERSLVVSVHDQKLAVVDDGKIVAKYPISTSRFGVGDSFRSFRTPLGKLKVSEKVGYNLPTGAVIKGRRYTGEVLKANAGGRDPIVTRVLWLQGLESQNRNAHDRGIYIHGTPVERQIGRPASYGCIRMKSRDVVEVFRLTPVGTGVEIVNESLREHLAKEQKAAAPASGEPAKEAGKPDKKSSNTAAKADKKPEEEHESKGFLGGIFASTN